MTFISCIKIVLLHPSMLDSFETEWQKAGDPGQLAAPKNSISYLEQCGNLNLALRNVKPNPFLKESSPKP